MESSITGYHQDEAGDWVAELACGHNQHARHRPPFQLRAWVLDSSGRSERVGTALDCPLCDRAELPERLPPLDLQVDQLGAVRFSPEHLAAGSAPQVGAGEAGSASPVTDGGDPACWAGLLCPHCDAVVDRGVHRPECPDAGAIS